MNFPFHFPLPCLPCKFIAFPFPPRLTCFQLFTVGRKSNEFTNYASRLRSEMWRGIAGREAERLRDRERERRADRKIGYPQCWGIIEGQVELLLSHRTSVFWLQINQNVAKARLASLRWQVACGKRQVASGTKLAEIAGLSHPSRLAPLVDCNLPCVLQFQYVHFSVRLCQVCSNLPISSAWLPNLPGQTKSIFAFY